MRHLRLTSLASSALPLLMLCGAAHADSAPDVGARIEIVPAGTIITPSSSIELPALAGVVAHTNVKIFRPSGISPQDKSPSGIYETPASLACVYHVTKAVAGCNPTTLKTVATGGSRIIAIVDAYDDPNAEKDLAVFSKKFGLPAITSSNFEVVYADGTKPAQDSTGGWELEESLDVQMAHALAPKAKVVLVEAKSASNADLDKAETVAIKLVEAAGGGEVSNRWGGTEYGGETKNETIFSGKTVVVFASAGDSPGVIQPSALPDVVSVGGTSINRKSDGTFVSQTTWSSGGGGLSAFIDAPTFQKAVKKIVGSKRGTPDLAADANPQTGAWIYDTIPYSGSVLDWAILGGTSVASPLLASIVNNAGSFNASGTDELAEIYAHLGDTKAFTDITKGRCGNSASGHAGIGYDLCTGVGAPVGTVGK
jgi:subtilase family serine protease